MIRKPVSLIVCLTLLLAPCLGGCDEAFEPAVNSNLGTTIEKDDLQTAENIHIRDKNLLYKQQNNTEIVTMYLTVSTGNSAENTDHTWEEINT